MIYPQDFERKTGFDKVRRLVGEKCLSALGEERAGEMSFSTDYAHISELLNQTDEFIRILRGEREFPTAFFLDVRYPLKRIRPEGTFLEAKELFDLKRSLETIRDIVRFFGSADGAAAAYPTLAAFAGNVPVFPQLIGQIDAILDKSGKVKDNASPALSQIRKAITATMSGISRSLQSILRAAQQEGLVDKDVAPTLRDGRLMIPVAPAFKRKIRGIVHDESASGKTVFIKPEAVVEGNNRIRELEAEERREIIRILTGITDRLRPIAPDLLLSYEFLADIDFIRAKALFAEQINAIRPEMEAKPQIDWLHAVHPLLFLSHQKQDKQDREVAPLDILLTDDNRILLISGPNAGGKSVCLKTVGLLQYMLQSGLPIPVSERSHTGIFSGIFIDIGDEQSIENDLSTYSSHLMNMKYFAKNCNGQTLILIDEFGSGTEPQIGGAIAEALLDRFNRKGSFGVITTHYRNLKRFAEGTPGIVNGAMLYDRHLMQPLFQLSIGNPGSSFAVEIARKIGLPEDVIADASDKAGADYIRMDKYLQDIVRDKRYWEAKRDNIRRQEKRLNDLASRYEHNLETAEKERKEIIRTAREEAERLLAAANAQIEKTIREIREAQAEKEQTRLARRALDEFKAAVLRAGENDAKAAAVTPHRKRKATAPSLLPEAPLKAGDPVRLKGQTSVGTLLKVQGKRAVVAFGMMKTASPLDKLERAGREQIGQEKRKDALAGSQTSDRIREKKLNFKPEVDVRGMRGDEALHAVACFIDDAILVGVSPVRILHGTGGGVLRQLIREYLPAVAGVERCYDEHVQFGGAGITVVELA